MLLKKSKFLKENSYEQEAFNNYFGRDVFYHGVFARIIICRQRQEERTRSAKSNKVHSQHTGTSEASRRFLLDIRRSRRRISTTEGEYLWPR